MKALSYRARLAGLAAAVVAAAFATSPAQAGLFEDDDARRAILELRQKLDQVSEQARTRQAEQLSQIATQMAAQMAEQQAQMKRSLLELNSQLEQQRGDNARLRGQMEQLTRDIAEVQRKQTDIAQGVEDRIRRIEPQKVTLDNKEFLVEPEEKKQYDEALAAFRKGSFDRASALFGAHVVRYPTSGYRETSLFWLGNAQYANREYKEAISTFRTLVTAMPDSPRAPEAMLAIANCQAELKDAKAAKKTIEDLVKTYPKSEAALAGRERLASLR